MNSTAKGNSGYKKCSVILHQCLAIIVRKEGCRGDPGDFWMYENGYLLFQGLLSSNSVCWWNTGLNGATKSLNYHGYISPGALLVGSEPCAIDILKNAWSRRVLQPPPGYQIVGLEDIDSCYGTPILQTQWTPLPEAVCAVVLRLSRQGRPAGIETIREALILTFPHVSPPSEPVLYDTLAQLTAERKLYHTSNGYFIVTPERRRSRSHSRGRRRMDNDAASDPVPGRTMLMSTEEALVMVHGDMATIRDGDVTHQLIQTNLADVICGGNASDKILYARTAKHSRTASMWVTRSPDRRGSFRLWRSNRRLKRSASTRSLGKHYVDAANTSSSDNSSNAPSTPSPKKESLLTRLFRKSKRPQCQISTFSAQFPPSEWFNSKAVHLHSIGTQTSASDKSNEAPPSSYLENAIMKPSRAATLPRRRAQRFTDLSYTSSANTRENSPVSKRNPNTYVTCTLPRNPLKQPPRNREGPKKPIRNINPTKQQYVDTATNNETQPRTSSDSLPTAAAASAQKPSQKIKERAEPLEQPSSSGPSSIESHKSSTKTESSFNSGPSSLESHKTVINALESLRMQEEKAKNSPKYRKKEPSSTPKSSGSNSRTSPPSGLHQSNSFTLQVTTNQGLSKLNNKSSSSSTTTTATINGETGTGTKIFVQNSPIRSVITFENGQVDDRNPNLVIINDTEHPQQSPVKNTNHQQGTMKNSNESFVDQNGTPMNNRKLSLQLPTKDSLSYHNVIKNVSMAPQFNQFSSSNPSSPSIGKIPKGICTSSPPSPTKSSETLSLSSINNIYIKNDMGSLTRFDSAKKLEKNLLGSEPNISYKDNGISKDSPLDQQFPSLNDLTFNFTSLAAQKILKGAGLNSVDTLVELNMSANMDKQNNCDVLHTDFGMF